MINTTTQNLLKIEIGNLLIYKFQNIKHCFYVMGRNFDIDGERVLVHGGMFHFDILHEYRDRYFIIKKKK